MHLISPLADGGQAKAAYPALEALPGCICALFSLAFVENKYCDAVCVTCLLLAD